MVSLSHLLYNTSFSILPCLEGFPYDFLEELFLFPPTRCTTNLFPFGIYQIIDSPGKVPSSENEAAYLIQEEFCLRTAPSFLACPTRVALQTENNLFVLQDASSYDIRLQIIWFERHLLLEQLGQLVFQGNSAIQKNFSLSE